MKKIINSLLIFFAVLFFLNSIGFTKTLVVDDNYPKTCESGMCIGPFCFGFFSGNSYKTIQEAVNHANNGDTIKICKGNYNESVTVTQSNLTITNGRDVSEPTDVKWVNNSVPLLIGTWNKAPSNIKIENISLTNTSKSSGSYIIHVLKAKQKITFDNLVLKNEAGKAIYFDWGVNSNLQGIFKNLIIRTKNSGIIINKGSLQSFDNVTIYLSGKNSNDYGIELKNNVSDKAHSFKDININTQSQTAIFLDSGKNMKFENITITASQYNSDYSIALLTGWNVSSNANLQFKNITIKLNRGEGIHIRKAKNLSFDTISLNGSSGYGIYLNTNVKGDISFKNVKIEANHGYGIYVNSGKDINVENCNIKGIDKTGYDIFLNWNVTGTHIFKNSIFSTKTYGIIIRKAKKVTFDNITLTGNSPNSNYWGIFGDSNIKGDFTIKNSTINVTGIAIYLKNGKPYIENSNITSQQNHAFYFDSNTDQIKIKNSCVFKKSTGWTYDVYIHNWKHNAHVNNNCFYGNPINTLAKAMNRGNDFNGNFWQGLSSGSYNYNNVVDNTPLASCQLACGGSHTSTPVANYQMDECIWNGTSGEVIDNSSNHLNGTAMNGATTDNGKLCRSGVFDGVNDYIKVNDNDKLDNTNKLTIMAWIYPTQLKQTNGTNARGVLSKRNTYYINGQNAYGIFFWNGHSMIDTDGDGDPDKARLYIDIDGSNNRFATNHYIEKNKWTHIAVVYDGTLSPNKRVKVFINGILDKISSETSSSIPNYSSNLTIGNLYTGMQYKVFKGKIDEVKIFNNALTESNILNYYKNESSGKNWDGSSRTCNSCPTPALIDHINIEDKDNDHQAIACEPELVCFTAKDIDNNTLTNYTGEIKIGSFLNSSSKGSWYKNYSGYSNPDPPAGNLYNEGHSTVGYTFQSADKGSFCLFLSYKNLTNNPDNIKVLTKTANEGIENSSNIRFYKGALKFLWENESSSPWNYQISCKDSSTNPKTNNSKLYLMAINTNDETGACEKLFNGNVQLKGRILYINPDTSTIKGSPFLYVNKNKVSYKKDNNPDKWDNIKLNFTNGKAELNLLYNDAGKLKLQFAYNYSGSYITTLNSNNEITFSPFGIFIDFQNIDAKDNSNISFFSKTLKASGDTFYIIAKGVCYDANDDKSPKDGVPDTGANLSDNKMPLKNFHSDITLNWAVANPAGGTGSLKTSKITDTDFDSNGNGIANEKFSDVGILKIDYVTARDYIFSDNNITGWPLHKYIGRFIPHHFSITSVNTGILRENCTTFNYSGDTISYLVHPSFKIIAQNKDNQTTQNYKNAFAFLTASDITLSYPSEDDNQIGNSKQIEINITPGSNILKSNNNGTFDFTIGNDKIIYLKNDNSKISPFAPQFSITVSNISDKDNVPCNNTPQLLTVSGQKIKFGKLKIYDNYGPEIENLKMKLRAYFWNNGDWELNQKDSCTTFNSKNDFNLSNFTDNLNAGETDIISNFPLTLTNGEGSITLSAPGKNNYGSVTVDFSTNQFLHDDNSSGIASFGIYRGRDRIIMWEEVPSK